MTTDSVVRASASRELVSALDVIRATETYLMVWDTLTSSTLLTLGKASELDCSRLLAALSVDSGGGSLPRVLVVHRSTHEEHRGDSVASVTSEEARQGSSEEVRGTEVASATETASGGSRWKSLRVYLVGVVSAVAIGVACWFARKYNLIRRIRTWLQKS